MRFFEDGPNIPDQLITQRDLGNVVFFCGAGLSVPAGLPDFAGLTRRLIKKMGALKAQEVLDRGDSLDQVFTAMVKEFGGSAVDRRIADALRAPRGAELRYHRMALDLSRGPSGQPQIVTTNFDLLFERSEPGVRRYVPPSLPDLVLLEPIRGVVYLHGRLARPGPQARAGYVISSADFGRAYLAEGWAARFVRELRDRYTIVLLGYSANDPPMRYLLEGLNSREGGAHRGPIYAFASGSAGAVEEEWQDKGVTTIAYDPLDRQHSGLWDTLEAWARAARDRDGWQKESVALAQCDPVALRAFERGRVASLVSTKAGARAFADAEPQPPANWLNVFDAQVRYGRPGRRNIFNGDEPELDPQTLYGLDDDPPRPPPKRDQPNPPAGDDLLRWRFGDDSWPERLHLGTGSALSNGLLPQRLFHLSRWLGDVLDQPAAVWWAAGRTALHPGLLDEIRRGIERNTLHAAAKHFWLCYLEGQRQQADVMEDGRWYDFGDRLKDTGWTPGAVRQFEQLIQPAFEITRPTLFGSLPPTGTWQDLPLMHVANIDVRVPRWDDGTIVVTADILPTIVAIVRRALERTAALLAESTTILWRTPTLHPTGLSGDETSGRKAGYFLKFKALFLELATQSAELARREYSAWDGSDPYFFGKLVLYGASLPMVTSGAEAAARILGLPDRIFWNHDSQRELLIALRARWPDIPAAARGRLERRIANGPPRYDEDELVADHKLRAATRSASLLRWLELQGCALSPEGDKRLARLKSVHQPWDDGWAAHADDSNGPRGGFVRRITDMQGLDRIDLADVVDQAGKLNTEDLRQLRDFRPFEGLVKQAPLRALAALRLQARLGAYPVPYWRDLVSDWPDDARPRLSRLLSAQLARLPDDIFFALHSYIPRWFQRFMPVLARDDRRCALRTFDAIVARFQGAPPSVLASGVGITTVGGVPQERSEFSFAKSTNAPGGMFAQTLLELMGRPRRRGALPSTIGTRLEKLLSLPGDGAGHALCVIAQRLSWFEYWDEDWVQRRLVPLFTVTDPLAEGAWHGIARDEHLMTLESQRLLNPAFIALLKGEAPWQLDDSEQDALFRRLVLLSRAWREGEKPALRYGDVRKILQACGDGGRSSALAQLVAIAEEHGLWAEFVKPFLLKAWPHQLSLRSEDTARQFVRLLEQSGDRFPEAVAIILPLLRPVARIDSFAYRLRRGDARGRDYPRRFPAEMLALLDAVIGDDRTTLPWGLAEVLEAIVETQPELRQDERWRRLKDLAA